MKISSVMGGYLLQKSNFSPQFEIVSDFGMRGDPAQGVGKGGGLKNLFVKIFLAATFSFQVF